MQLLPLHFARLMKRSGTIGVVIALCQEARTLARELDDGGNITHSEGRLLVCVGGIGAARARSAAQRLLSDGASALLSWGVAAALVPDLKAGSLLVPTAVIDADRALLPVSGAWRRRIDSPATLDARPIAEVRSMLHTPAQKHALGKSLQAAAADMESAAVARIAQQAQVPFLAVRAIVDEASMAVPTWLMSCMDDQGRVDVARVAGQLLRHPRDAIDVSRLARGFRAARATLREFSAHHLQQLLVGPGGP